ncbi:hypothetical protein Mal4_24800 [Maioricimonas rarisocia]|uniref:3-keto-alpha-glucoside-1,2-lyase/3-keto-2-hydroxy-glucal hydratase domain-containing protein n=1 Tax=Maioricimonas rarisocia TaxID=2528026 RepID=A0A517Z6Q6_9PLAN|nr:DUF1080 domain-containing protein [Maioricimonas rarisocia]QDU38157.1 hypothetical protein Mal4_24800 [Maioricimonas rarisocia]
MNRISWCLAALTLLAVVSGVRAEDEAGWVKLTDGKTFDGWKINEAPDAWSIKDGAFVAKGPRSHLFYVGNDRPFENFELKVDVKAEANSNGGIYFHTKYQDEGWPKAGFETQVNNTYTSDPRKTGSLYAVQDVHDVMVEDDEWWTQHIIVQGNRVIVKVNGKTVVDYTEPEGQKPQSADFARLLGEGTFALQAHDPGSTVHYRNIRVKRLP